MPDNNPILSGVLYDTPRPATGGTDTAKEDTPAVPSNSLASGVTYGTPRPPAGGAPVPLGQES